MTMLSMRTRRKAANYGLSGALAFTVILVQTTLLSHFPVRDPLPVYCNLPLTVAIVWGAVFGSPIASITPDELRLSTVSQVFTRQLLSGSLAGALMGALLAALYAPILTVFPFYLPFAGWMAGYFCLRNINKQNVILNLSLLAPLVFVISLMADTIMAWQLSLPANLLVPGSAGRAGAFDNLMQIAISEASLNMIISSFIYFPVRFWYDASQTVKAPVER
jgi:hypothetical protein